MDYFYFKRKCVLDLLKEIGLLRYKPACIPVELDLDVWSKDNTLYLDDKQYMRIIDKLIYLIVTRSVT